MSHHPASTVPEVTRRQVLVTGGVVVAAAAVSAACGAPGRPTTAATGPSTVTTTDVPVGGGLVLGDRAIVITQPAAGHFTAFSAICTHEGCLVASVADGAIVCPCHNGLFSAVDGSVQGGPPPTALAPVAITVSGSTITVP